MAYALTYNIALDPPDADLVDFDAWVVIPSAVAEDIAAACKADGADVAFFAADGTTALPFERVAYSVTGGAATGVWKVGIPAVSSSTGASIVMKCGDSLADDLSDSTLGTPYDAYTQLMVHFRADENGDLVCTDSSGNGNDAVNHGATVGTGGPAGVFASTVYGNYLDVPEYTYSTSVGKTLAFYAKTTVVNDYRAVCHVPACGNPRLLSNDAGHWVCYGSGPACEDSIVAGQWYSLVVVYPVGSSSDGLLYVDGAIGASGLAKPVEAVDTLVLIAYDNFGVGLSGGVSTSRCDDTPRSAAWIDCDNGTLMEAGNRQAWTENLIPYATTGLTATYGTQTTKVALEWDANDMATTYKVYRNTTNSTSGATLVASGVATTTYEDTEAPIGVPLYYFVKATNEGGDSDYSSSALGFRKLDTTKLPDPTTEVLVGADCINSTFDGYTVGSAEGGGGNDPTLSVLLAAIDGSTIVTGTTITATEGTEHVDGSYPTTATSKAAQLADDRLELSGVADHLQRSADGGPSNVLGTVNGTLNTAAIASAAFSEGEASQLATDRSEVDGVAEFILRPADGGPATVLGTVTGTMQQPTLTEEEHGWLSAVKAVTDKLDSMIEVVP